jgi:hypothetical protein
VSSVLDLPTTARRHTFDEVSMLPSTRPGIQSQRERDWHCGLMRMVSTECVSRIGMHEAHKMFHHFESNGTWEVDLIQVHVDDLSVLPPMLSAALVGTRNLTELSARHTTRPAPMAQPPFGVTRRVDKQACRSP